MLKKKVINTNVVTKDDLLQEQQDEPIVKKRGRPKKIIPVQQVLRVVKKNTSDTKEYENQRIVPSVIVKIPNFSPEASIATVESELDYDDEEDIEIEYTNAEETNMSFFCTDNDSDEESEFLSTDAKKKFKNELKKKDSEIKQLREMCAKSESNFDIGSNKHKRLNMNVFNEKIIHVDNKKNTSGIACWWCSCDFDTTPCFIPEKYRNGTYYVFGNYCSYNCALAYILKDDEYKIDNRKSLVKKLYSELYETNQPLQPAHPKEILQKFGGPMTIDEYRNEYTLAIKNFNLVLENISCYFEESTNKPAAPTALSYCKK